MIENVFPEKTIWDISSEHFDELALEIFHFQAKHNAVYNLYLNSLGVNTHLINDVSKIVFLPIELYKHHVIKTGSWNEEMIFTSSGTTSSKNSKHFVRDVSFYEKCFFNIFDNFYGRHQDYCFLALLPSYMERSGSSLVFMAEKLISNSIYNGGFFLDDHRVLYDKVISNETARIPTVLLGVSFALLDFAEKYSFDQPLEHTIVMETGGMKGRRKEMVRNELHNHLKRAFKVPAIHSEYGMTELMSQAYAKENGIFNTPPWMRVYSRDINDPLSLVEEGHTGALNIIDLANLNTCSFIETADLGKSYGHKSFEVLGRLDHSDLRGCSLLI